jgi:organic radical activating enzyme
MRLVQIELTNKCNLSCPFCFRKYMTRKQGFMTTRMFNKSLKLCKEMGVDEVWLHNWGEPLLHPKLLNFLTLAKDFRKGFATNGTLLTNDLLIKLSQRQLNLMDLSFNSTTTPHRYRRLLEYYEVANDLMIDCRFRVVVNNIEEYKWYKGLLKGRKVRWQRAMVVDKSRVRTKVCEARKHVCVILWTGEVIPCCYMYDGKNEELCKHCFEVEDKMDVRYKL